MSRSTPVVGRVRLLSAARLAYGLTVAVAPRRVVSVYAGRPAHEIEAKVARILGVRHVAQALICAAQPTSATLLLGAEADAAHAVSMVALAAIHRHTRRAALVDGAIAAGFTTLGLLVARSADSGSRAAPANRLARRTVPTFARRRFGI